MATTYFGACDSSGNIDSTNWNGSDNNVDAIFVYNNSSSLTFTCPGSGNQSIKELSAYVHVDSGSPKTRCAVYATDKSTRFAQGNSAVSLSGASDSWQGHMSAGAITQDNYLVGGTNYLLVWAQDSGGTAATTHTNPSGASYYDFVDKVTGGYSGALATTYTGGNWPVRCGVDQAVTGPVEPRTINFSFR